MKNIYPFKEFMGLKVSGELLDVGDGDAIVLVLEKENKKLLVVIDGGDTSYASKVCEFVSNRCIELKKQGPDLVICTHYDSDHIAGMLKIVEHFQKNIGMIWVHQPTNFIEESFKPVTELLENTIVHSVIAENLKIIGLSQTDPDQKFNILLESIKQVENLVDLITKYKIPTKEPFAQECDYQGWEEIKILGPSRDYYNSLFKRTTLPDFFAEEYRMLLSESVKVVKKLVANPCSLLETNPKTSVTNRASVVIRIDVGTKKLLFTGDAGLDSFETLIGYPNSIRNMEFLKIPHHGSINNITKELIEIINPKRAFNSGDKYENINVINCLRNRGCEVKTTKDGGDLRFVFN